MTSAQEWYRENPLYIGVYVISAERRLACGLPIEEKAGGGPRGRAKELSPIDREPRRPDRARPIEQLDIEGRYLCGYDDAADAQSWTGFPADEVLSACKAPGGRLGGYTWRFAS